MRLLSLARLVAACTLVTASASASLVNGNFDADNTIPEGSAQCNGGGGFLGWTSLGGGCGTGIWNPGASAYPGGTAPSDNNALYMNGPVGYWQTDTSAFWTAGETQTLRILIGQRLDEIYLGYTIELWAGNPVNGTGTLVAGQTNAIPVPAPGTFVPTSLSYTPTGTETFLGQNVTVLIRGGSIPGGVQTNFDNAELSGVPEPGTYALVGSALIGLAAWRRKRG